MSAAEAEAGDEARPLRPGFKKSRKKEKAGKNKIEPGNFAPISENPTQKLVNFTIEKFSLTPGLTRKRRQIPLF